MIPARHLQSTPDFVKYRADSTSEQRGHINKSTLDSRPDSTPESTLIMGGGNEDASCGQKIFSSLVLSLTAGPPPLSPFYSLNQLCHLTIHYCCFK